MQIGKFLEKSNRHRSIMIKKFYSVNFYDSEKKKKQWTMLNDLLRCTFFLHVVLNPNILFWSKHIKNTLFNVVLCFYLFKLGYKSSLSILALNLLIRLIRSLIKFWFKESIQFHPLQSLKNNPWFKSIFNLIFGLVYF